MNWKVFFMVTQICVYGFSTARKVDSEKILSAVVSGVSKYFERVIATLLTNKFVQRREQDNRDQLHGSLFSKFEDPAFVDGKYDFVLLGNSDFISGNVSMSGGVITGLSSVFEDLRIEPTKMSYDLNAGKINMTGNYTGDIFVNRIVSISGNGALVADIELPTFKITVNVEESTFGKIIVTAVAVEIAFHSLYVSADKFKICGREIDWYEFNGQAKLIFDAAWANIKPHIDVLVRNFMTEVLKECKLEDLDAGDFLCTAPSIPSTTTTAPKPTTPIDLTPTIPETEHFQANVGADMFINSAMKYVAHVVPNLECEYIYPPPTTMKATVPTTTTSTKDTSFAASCKQIAINLLLLTTFLSTMFSFQLCRI